MVLSKAHFSCGTECSVPPLNRYYLLLSCVPVFLKRQPIWTVCSAFLVSDDTRNRWMGGTPGCL